MSVARLDKGSCPGGTTQTPCPIPETRRKSLPENGKISPPLKRKTELRHVLTQSQTDAERPFSGNQTNFFGCLRQTRLFQQRLWRWFTATELTEDFQRMAAAAEREHGVAEAAAGGGDGLGLV